MILCNALRIDPAYRARLRAARLDNVDAILARTDDAIVAWSRTTDSIYVPAPDGGVGYYVKRYYYPTWRHRLRGLFRGTFFGLHRGKAEARALSQMRSAGVPAVRPIAHGTRRVGRFLSACFLITEETPEAPNLTTFAQHLATGKVRLTTAARRLAAQQLAGQVRAMHAAGVAHGRLFWRNILIRRGAADGFDFFFLDAILPRQFERLGRGRQWWLWELAKLATSAEPFTTRTERLRFLRNYLGRPRLDVDARLVAREIARLVPEWRPHETQRIRMNARFERWRERLSEASHIATERSA